MWCQIRWLQVCDAVDAGIFQGLGWIIKSTKAVRSILESFTLQPSPKLSYEHDISSVCVPIVVKRQFIPPVSTDSISELCFAGGPALFVSRP